MVEVVICSSMMVAVVTCSSMMVEVEVVTYSNKEGRSVMVKVVGESCSSMVCVNACASHNRMAFLGHRQMA